MVVVGDRKSANTKHLTEICRELCPRVYQIEGAEELTPDLFIGCSLAGLTAGASTPAGIIKEVYATMSEEIKNNEIKEESFEELLDKSFKTLNTGEKVTGIVTAVGPTEVQVDLGCKQAGYIAVDELSADPNVKPEDVVKVGDEIETYIVRVNDVEGYATLSKKRLDAVKVWEDIEEARENKTTLEGKVTEENKGGIVVNVKGVRVFVPASQSGQPRGADLSEMIGQTVSLRITEVNRARRRVVGSIRAVQYEARQAAQAAIWESIEVGKHYTGTVKSMTSYGVFVDIGGVDGMVHISELSWSRIKNPAEVVSVGDTLDVYVISFDPEKHKISLGVKDHSCNPWDTFMNTYKVGDVANVRIVKLMTFGAFAEVVPGVDGLIHISDLSWTKKIKHPGEFTSVGAEIEVVVLEVDKENRRLSLGHKQLEENPWNEFEGQFAVDSVHEGTITEMTDKGAVVSLGENVEGFAPMRQLVKEDGTTATVGEKLPFKVIEFSKATKRITLSHTRLFEEAKRAERAEQAAEKKASAEATKSSMKKINASVEKTTLGDIAGLAELKDAMEAAAKEEK